MVMVLCLCSCTKYNYINGGTANGIHDCTMWEYFHTNSYDWDSTVVMIEHAGLKSLFDGTGEYKQITFFGLTSNSILRYMLENNYERVTDIPVGKCQDIIQKLVAPKRIMLNDVPRGNRIQSGGGIESAFVEYDGLVFDCIRGSLFLWTQGWLIMISRIPERSHFISLVEIRTGLGMSVLLPRIYKLRMELFIRLIMISDSVTFKNRR